MKILVIDNYDSFTYNLVHLIKALGYRETDVWKNDQIVLSEVDAYGKIVLSPGPGVPSEAGSMESLIKNFAGKKPMLGVCLGHQAIAECFGANLINLDKVYHGVSSDIFLQKRDYIFEGLPSVFKAGRYHSWIVDKNNLPACLEITSEDKEGQIMSIVHKTYDIHGLQFHPESILSPEGVTIIKNFLEK